MYKVVAVAKYSRNSLLVTTKRIQRVSQAFDCIFRGTPCNILEILLPQRVLQAFDLQYFFLWQTSEKQI